MRAVRRSAVFLMTAALIGAACSSNAARRIHMTTIVTLTLRQKPRPA